MMEHFSGVYSILDLTPSPEEKRGQTVGDSKTDHRVSDIWAQELSTNLRTGLDLAGEGTRLSS